MYVFENFSLCVYLIKHTRFFAKFPLLVTGSKIRIQAQHYSEAIAVFGKVCYLTEESEN